MKDILNSYLYSNCAIQDMDNKLLMWGEVEAVTDELAMDIAPGEDCLVPHMLHGTPVRAVLRNRSKILILDCTICGFNGTVLRVENIEKFKIQKGAIILELILLPKEGFASSVEKREMRFILQSLRISVFQGQDLSRKETFQRNRKFGCMTLL